MAEPPSVSNNLTMRSHGGPAGPAAVWSPQASIRTTGGRTLHCHCCGQEGARVDACGSQSASGHACLREIGRLPDDLRRRADAGDSRCQRDAGRRAGLPRTDPEARRRGTDPAAATAAMLIDDVSEADATAAPPTAPLRSAAAAASDAHWQRASRAPDLLPAATEQQPAQQVGGSRVAAASAPVDGRAAAAPSPAVGAPGPQPGPPPPTRLQSRGPVVVQAVDLRASGHVKQFLLASRGRTVVSVPKPLRRRLGAVLRVQGRGDPLTWTAVLAGVLADGHLTAARLGALQRGKPDQALAYASDPGPRRLPDPRLSALRLLCDGCPAKALQRLGDGGAASTARGRNLVDDPRTQRALQALFPRAALSGTDCVPQPSRSAVAASGDPELGTPDAGVWMRSRIARVLSGDDPQAFTEEVRRAVGRAPRRSCPGVSGARSDHLDQIARAPGGDEFVSGLAAAVDVVLAGEADGALRDCRLVPVVKTGAPGPGAPGFKPRPIGVGETIATVAKRLASKILRAKAVPIFGATGQHLETPDGCPLIARRIAAAHDAGYWVVALDISNAFNSVTRKAVVETTNEVCPEASGFVHWTLAQPSSMWLTPEVPIEASRGVVQGCPLAPTLFALTLTRALKAAATDAESQAPLAIERLPDGVPPNLGRTAATPACVYQAWFADDGHVAASSPQAALTYVRAAQRRLADIGLQLNTDKCRVLPPKTPTGTQVLSGSGPASAQRSADQAAIDALGQTVTALTVLGIPVGDARECREYVKAKVTQACDRVRLIARLESPFAEVRALQACGPRSLLEFLVKHVPRDVFDDDLLDEVEAAEREAIRHVLRGYAGDVDDMTLLMRWVRLPIHRGGLGVLSLKDAFEDDPNRPGYRQLKSAIHREAAFVKAEDEYIAKLAERPDGALLMARYRELAANNGQAMRWLGSGRFVDKTGKTDPDLEATAIALLAGVPTLAGVTESGIKCPRNCRERGTGEGVKLDCHGQHVLACRSLTLTHRHDAVRDALYTKMVAWFGASAVSKETGIDPSGQATRRGQGQAPLGAKFPGDVHLNLGSQEYFLDVVVRSTWACNILPVAAREGNEAARRGYFDKDKSDAAREVRTRGRYYHPIALGGFGGMARGTENWLRDMEAKVKTGEPFGWGEANHHKLRPGEPAMWQQVAQALSHAVVMAHAKGICNVKVQLRGRKGDRLSPGPRLKFGIPVTCDDEAREPAQLPPIRGGDGDGNASVSVSRVAVTTLQTSRPTSSRTNGEDGGNALTTPVAPSRALRRRQEQATARNALSPRGGEDLAQEAVQELDRNVGTRGRPVGARDNVSPTQTTTEPSTFVLPTGRALGSALVAQGTDTTVSASKYAATRFPIRIDPDPDPSPTPSRGPCGGKVMGAT